MRRRPTLAIMGAMLLSALALAGCSDSSAPKSQVVSFTSPAVVGHLLPALYTCDGKDIPPPMEWGAVPSTTRELALFVIGLTPNSKGTYTPSIDWAVAGVNPALHKLAAGELPLGAHVALDNRGKRVSYSVCPARGKAQDYQFALYAVPAAITVPPNFVGSKLLEVVANPQSPDPANAGGAFLAVYKRPGHAPGRVSAKA
jgi:phosphatidylethanolamine-binding protein (PEBP) family uncharacterized protein